MPQLVKDIVRAGKYHIPGNDGTTREVTITPKMMESWVATFNKQRMAGLNIPAPGHHDFDKAVPVRIGTDGTLKSSDDNYGFWEALWVDPESKTLKGIVTAPGDLKDPNTPAGKLGTTVKETSIYIQPKWKDGAGTDWENAVMHIACVTHPIQPGQPNFQPVDDGLAICMAFNQDSPDPSTPTDPNKVLGSEDPNKVLSAGTQNISEVINLLRKVAQIALPEDTTNDNIVERLLIALNQKALSNEDDDEGSVQEPPEGAQLRNAPFVMSFTQKQIEALTKVTNPETGKPFAVADFQQPPAEDLVMSHPKVKSLENATNVLLTVVTDQAKAGLRQRAASLVSTGRASKDYMDATIAPMIESLVMSFGPDQKPLKGPVDVVLEALEKLPAVVAPTAPVPDYSGFLAMSHGAQPAGTTVVNNLPHPLDNNGNVQMSEDQLNGVFGRLKAAGILT